MPEEITCESCGQRYRITPELAGKKVRCKCGSKMRIPDQEPADAPDPYALETGAAAGLDLGAAAEAEAAAEVEPAAAPVGSRACPSCEAPVAGDAALCVQCGYNFDTGESLTTATGGRAIKEAGSGPRRAAYGGSRDGFFGRLSRSWEFAKLSYGILWDFKGLLVFPVFSGIALFLVMLSFVLPLWGLGTLDQFAALLDEEARAEGNLLVYAITFVFYFTNFFVIVFFNTALAACALKVCAGDPPTIGYGLSIACKRLPQIVAWALVSATVGLILKIIENASDKVGQIITMLLGTAWAVLTYFVVPVLAVEGVGPVTAVKRSVGTLKETWGEAALGNFSMALLAFLLSLPLYLVCLAMIFLGISGNLPALAIAGVLLIFVVAVLSAVASSAADMVFRTILYSYATGATVPEEVDDELFAAAFASKG